MQLKQLMLVGAGLMLSASLAVAEEQKQDMKAMMEKMEKAGAPGEQHKQLAKMEGKWETKTKSWMEPNTPPMETMGSCEHKMVMDGRFLKQKCMGDMMGKKFEGVGVTGYDNTSKKYTSTWMDNMSTSLHVMEGMAGDAKTINQQGETTCPIRGHMKLRSVMKIVDDNTHVFEMYGTDDKGGQEVKMMEITYTRKS
ncbi:conserved exported protein of unknown function [Nitrospira japonica]|uniref:DUF1579 domain-containing protein n=1 Tax=Nitrospira japonica TaxID=1325564 RepID=A0A1W1I6C7_9BACT|nr:DUF1579 domain-containing protein [Nitrospira japonica]SLM48393.1 conserved exported protein of unknown function [Nitrospira japonica]